MWTRSDPQDLEQQRGTAAVMVLKTTLCRFSGLRIYPGRGILFIRVDNQQVRAWLVWTARLDRVS